MFFLRPTYAPIKGKWSVKYCKDTLLSGFLFGENRFAIYYGEPDYDLRSDLIDKQRLSIERLQKRVSGVFHVLGQKSDYAWGTFYWMLDGSDKKYIYDVRIRFIDRSVAKMDLIPATKSDKYYRDINLIDTDENIRRGMNDYIVGLIKVNNERNQMWGSTTSIDSEGSNERFVSLPYFIANRMEEKTESLFMMAQPIEYWNSLPETQRSLIGTAGTWIGVILGVIGLIVGVRAFM